MLISKGASMAIDLQTVEDKIKGEWNWVRGMIATNQTVSLGIFGGACFILGAFLF